jgi:hypothetical protein
MTGAENGGTTRGAQASRSAGNSSRNQWLARGVLYTPVDSQNRSLVIVAGGLAVFFVGILCLGASAVGVVFAARSGGPAPPAPPPVPNGLPALDHHVEPDDPSARDPSRPRYRPGPHVTVVGTLPAAESRRERRRDRVPHTGGTPWTVLGSEFRSQAAPNASEGGGAPTVRLGRSVGPGETTVVAGTPVTFGLSSSPGEGHRGPIQGVLIAFHDYPGHFFLPASVDTELGYVRVEGVDDLELHFGMDAAVRPDGTPIVGGTHRTTMYIAVIDLEGRVSPYVQRGLAITPVGVGDVEVTLTMSRATDLDLYVVDPNGTVVYYGNTSSPAGGQLDLDANAACSNNMGVNNEHIFFPPGAAPAGTYVVRVANFQSCISNQAVDFRVTVQVCGETVVFAGSTSGPGESSQCLSPGGDPTRCQDVVEFDVDPCS